MQVIYHDKMGSGCCDMRGYLRFIVLKLISKNNMSGSDIAAEIEKRKGSRPSPGTIYPVLKTLGEFGLIEEIKDSGKEKKYRITSEGKKELGIATKRFMAIFFDMLEEKR